MPRCESQAPVKIVALCCHMLADGQSKCLLCPVRESNCVWHKPLEDGAGSQPICGLPNTDDFRSQKVAPHLFGKHLRVRVMRHPWFREVSQKRFEIASRQCRKNTLCCGFRCLWIILGQARRRLRSLCVRGSWLRMLLFGKQV